MDKLIELIRSLSTATIKPGNLIYHYTSAKGLKGILENKCIWATDNRFLNDPTEIKYSQEILLKSIVSIEDLKNDKETVDSIIKEYVYYPKYNIYLISFCENNDSVSMWNYYAESNGFSLEIEKEKLIKELKVIGDTKEITDVKYYFGKVIYNKKDQIDKIQKTLKKHVLDNINGNDKNKREIIKEFIKQYFSLSPFLKHQSYEDEKEVRLVILLSEEDTKKFCYYRLSQNGIFIPYIKIGIILNNRLIRSIKLHPLQMFELSKSGLSEYLQNVSLISNIEIIKSDVPFRKI